MFGLVFKYFPHSRKCAHCDFWFQFLQAWTSMPWFVNCAGNEAAYELAKLAELREPTHLQAK